MNNRSTKLMTGLAILAAAPWIIASTMDRSSVGDDSTTVTIVGTGKSEQSVQLITIGAGVTTFATSATRAMSDNSGTMAKIKGQLRRHGLDPKDIRTTNLQLSPYTRHEDGRDTKGYNVSHNLTIVFRDIEKSGPVIDALVNAGANQVQGPQFSWEASEEALQSARIAAIRDADVRAKFFAKALGLKIKRVVTMRDGGGYASGQPAPAMAARAEGTEISPGQDVVRASVYGEYELVK